MNTQAKTAVLTGANSGIGLALTHKLLAEGYRVIGTSRSGQIADFSHPNLTVISLDVTDEASIAQAVAQIGQLAPSIDLLVNNAGVGSDLGTITPTGTALRDTFATNVDGTILFTEPMLPLVRDGGQIVFLSSKMGLVSHAAADSPAYRISKAAINMYAAILAERVAERGISVTPMHPGWVQTRMGGDSAPFTTEQSAAGLFRGIQARPESGKFWNVEVDSLLA
ncbi:SDR family NAD(P)-dependent oxidoreductase [Hymenobacter sp. BT188]|uniref:SDR family NAD(P)-dependent oxidoreductase n=1 Tax=Hymenobacter sp. BT188 TaxID=2763504 RepID=UPI00165156DC|nr:SDR family NAD(P)-dependent oxidoreductase [Hymenobacter sp. BT188]MBC6605377.1 SDR family NAD(P)-dependent oxidoreductase [Hymenobacter sp. BT188]